VFFPEARPAMMFDEPSMSLAVASLVLGFLTIVIVGSQTREDARSVVRWTLCILVPMLVVSGACFVLPGRVGGFNGAPGMVVLCAVLILAVGRGYRIAAARDMTPTGKTLEPRVRDDELG
jgi:hypothetical protein